MQIKMRYTEPFYFPGNKTGCLLIHGFTGSPGEMRPLGEYLHAQGLTVQGIRLSGHGTTWEDMLKTGWSNWFSEVTEAYTRLASSCNDVFVIGLSMGGALALNLAEEVTVKGGIVPICAPIYLGERKAYLAPFLHYFIPYTEKKVGKKNYEAYWYEKYPTKSVAELVKGIYKVAKNLRKIECPTLIIQSKLDKTVQPRSAQYIYDNISSKDKKLYWLEKSGHVATLDIEREQVFSWIYEFIVDKGRR